MESSSGMHGNARNWVSKWEWKGRRAAISYVGIAAIAILLCSMPLASPVHAASATPYMSVAPTKGPVGSNMIITATGFPPSTSLTLYWSTDNTTWAVGLNPGQGDTNVPEVNGINTVNWELKLTTVQTDATGAFTKTVAVPVDTNGQHIIEAVGGGLNGSLGQAAFTLEPEFTFSPTSGPPGTPITVYATGLGNRLYAMEYHVLWDNGYLGYMTGVTTRGLGNFTFYATGAAGVHAITIYNGYPGPAFMNSNQAPASVAITSYDPPLIPFHGTFTITDAPTQSSQGFGGTGVLSLLALGVSVSALALTPVMAARAGLNKGFGRRGVSRMSVALLIGAIACGGVAVFLASGTLGTSTATTLASQQKTSTTTISGPASTSTITSTVTSTSTVVSATTQTTTMTSTVAVPPPGYDPNTPQSVVLRPITTIPPMNATSGPRIEVTPDVATVGTPVNVTGLGFAPNSLVPLTWTTHVGSHVTGFSSEIRSLKNVTSNGAGSFTFMMHTPADLYGIHNIIAPGLPGQGNGTLYIEDIASINATSGPVGSKIVISVEGTGWDYQDNMVAVDYDNSYIGYGCGFNENGNITITMTAYGGPGYHSIDLWPGLYEGPQVGQTPAIFRYPILTPFDGPEGIPAFHFSFIITSNSAQSSQGVGSGGLSAIAIAGVVSMGLGGFLLLTQATSLGIPLGRLVRRV